MKSIAAAALLALSLLSGAVRADEGKPTETIVIYASTMEDAMKQVEALNRGDVGTSVIIRLTNPDGSTAQAGDVGTTVVIL